MFAKDGKNIFSDTIEAAVIKINVIKCGFDLAAKNFILCGQRSCDASF